MTISLGLRRFALVRMGLISCGAGSAAEVDGAADAVRTGGSAGSPPLLALFRKDDTVHSLSPKMRQAVTAALDRAGMNAAVTDKASLFIGQFFALMRLAAAQALLEQNGHPARAAK